MALHVGDATSHLFIVPGAMPMVFSSLYIDISCSAHSFFILCKVDIIPHFHKPAKEKQGPQQMPEVHASLCYAGIAAPCKSQRYLLL